MTHATHPTLSALGLPRSVCASVGILAMGIVVGTGCVESARALPDVSRLDAPLVDASQHDAAWTDAATRDDAADAVSFDAVDLDATPADVVVADTDPCTPTANVVADFAALGTTWVELSIARGSAVAVALTQLQAGMTTELRTIQSTSTQSDLTAEIAISTCPGRFDVPAECKTWGTVWGSATQLTAHTTVMPIAGACAMMAGVQYYANVRNTQFDRTTPSCSVASCNMKLQQNYY